MYVAWKCNKHEDKGYYYINGVNIHMDTADALVFLKLLILLSAGDTLFIYDNEIDMQHALLK